MAAIQLSVQARARLRYVLPSSLFLEAPNDCIVCWRLPQSEANALKPETVTITAEVISAEGLDRLHLYLACRLEQSQTVPSLAMPRIPSKGMMDKLLRQQHLNLFALDPQLRLVTRKKIEWGDAERRKATRVLQTFLKVIEDDPYRVEDFFATHPGHQATYSDR